MKIFLIVFFSIVLTIYGSEDLFVFKLNPALNGGHAAEDNLKILPAYGLNNFYFFGPRAAQGIEWQFSQAT